MDENKIAEVCRNNGYTMSQIYKSTLIGITDMEKLMGRKIFKELLGDYIIKPKGRLTLVPETDKREEVHTLGEFRRNFNMAHLVTGKVRLSYEHIWEPASINDSDEKYSVSLIIPKSDTKTVKDIQNAVEQAKQDGKAKFGGRIPANLKLTSS